MIEHDEFAANEKLINLGDGQTKELANKVRMIFVVMLVTACCRRHGCNRVIV